MPLKCDKLLKRRHFSISLDKIYVKPNWWIQKSRNVESV